MKIKIIFIISILLLITTLRFNVFAVDDEFISNKPIKDINMNSVFKVKTTPKNISNDEVYIYEQSKSEEKIDASVYTVEENEINIIVELEDKESLLKTLATDKKAKGFEHGNFYTLKIRKNKIEELKKSSNVKKVWLDRWNKALLDISAPLIEANKIWNNSYNGSGVKVCVLDTGANKVHPALSSRVIAEADFTGSSSGADDIDGHGTHVAGIVASNNDTYKGIAYGASILNAKVLGDDGSGLDSWIMSGIDWCISQGADILTMSLGSLAPPTDGSDPLSQYVDLAADQGKILTIAAGNSGPNSGTLACPGCAHKVITVGSTQTGKSGTIVDLISDFSSRGPTDDGRIKPDVVAPGEEITSAQNTGGFIEFSGTSMSTPMVAGLSALLLQARPSLTPEEIKALIMNSVYDYGVFIKDNTYGAGRVNASRAFNEINFTKTGVILNSERVHNIYVPPGSQEIRATLYWPENYSIHNDVDLYILDPAGNIRDFSISAFNTDEMAIAENPIAGYWKILVFPYDASDSQKYAIASNYLPSEQFYIEVDSLSKIISHQINVTNCTQIKINTDWNSTSEDLDIYLYDTSGNLKAYSNGINNNHENLTADNPVICSSSGGGGCGCGGGSWLLKIAPFNLKNSLSVQYALTSNFPILDQISDTASPPDLKIENISTSAKYIAPSSSFKLLNTVKNIGSSIANSFNVSFHLSKDQVYGGSDDIQFTAFRSIKSLGAGAINSSNKELTIPSKTPLGNYYVCAFADANNTVNELDETKNTLCTNFTINVTRPDLVIKSLSGPKNATGGLNITIKDTVYNKGRVSAKSFYAGFYLSNNSKITPSDILLGNRTINALSALRTNTANTTVKIPNNVKAGNYYLGAIADFKNKVKELNESNNAKTGNKISIS